MAMKVNNINNIIFRANGNLQENSAIHKPIYAQINEIPNVSPDYSIKIPQKYTKLGIKELANGLELHMYKLANGHKISIMPIEGSPAIVKNYVNVGSMNETSDIKGISHFLEHMAFNGTNGENGHIKLEVGDSFKKIDNLGGWANASTNYAVTDYVNSTPLLNNGDLEQQIKIIAAMNEDLQLSQKMIDKEKHPVCSEINMILDNPQTIALDQTVRTLFNIKNPADEMVGGSVAHIKNLTRKDVVDYYNKYYTPDNMNLVITGDVNPDEAIKLVAKNFNSKKVSSGDRFEEKLSPIQKTVRKDFTSDKAHSCDIILGFAGPKNSDTKERVIYDVVRTYLLSYSTGLKQDLKKYNAYPYISSEKISTNRDANRMVYLATNVSDNNCEKVLETLFKTINNVKKPDENALNEIKEHILSTRDSFLEHSIDVNDEIGQAVLNNNLEYFTDYEKLLNSVTVDDVYNGIKKYFDLNKTAITVIHPENSNVSFKGKREPINEKKIKMHTLSNCFDVGLYETKNKNINYNISLCVDKPYCKKAGVVEVLDEILAMGSATMSDAEFSKYKEKNNLSISGYATPTKLKIFAHSNYDKRNMIFEGAKELLYNPRFTKENLNEAKSRIKDYLLRKQDTAFSVYANYESKINPYEFTDKEVLESLDSITLDDVKDCHKYLLENSRGVIAANVPEKYPTIGDEILKEANLLNIVKPNKVTHLELYKENDKPKVLTQVNNNSQADILQVHKFKCDNTIKETALAEITNSILSSSSIGLFDTLRERDHLAYSVHSDINKRGDIGEIFCNILTTTDNKNIGEFSYNNLQKSINGFNTQINELKNGNFTEKDLENAKLGMKANLLNNEGVDAKLGTIRTGLSSEYGITFINQLYNEIDKITKQDVINFATKMFKNPPTYSIVASKDTLNFNKNYLESLEA